jgi:septum formation protein
MPARTSQPLLLASASPRRRDLLAAAGVAFEVRPAHIPEKRAEGEAPHRYAARMAREKALAVARTPDLQADRVVLGADTIVVLDGIVFGKPRDASHAVALLAQLVGRCHLVITAVAVVRSGSPQVREIRVESRVCMHPAGRDEIEAYVATGEPLDKAGAYAVQGAGRRFVAGIDGSETNVIGLPLDESLALLRAEGIEARR